MPAVFWLARPVLSGKDCLVLNAATRRSVSGAGRSYSCLRGTAPLSLDALGARALVINVDFWSTVLGLTMFPIGYFLHALAKRHARQPCRPTGTLLLVLFLRHSAFSFWGRAFASRLEADCQLGTEGLES